MCECEGVYRVGGCEVVCRVGGCEGVCRVCVRECV